jgi:hypothetical protein
MKGKSSNTFKGIQFSLLQQLGWNRRSSLVPQLLVNLNHLNVRTWIMTLPPCRLSTFSLTLLIKTRSDPVQQDHLASLPECRLSPNPHTQHLRILDIVQGISQTSSIHHFNPTIIALPYLAGNQYLLVSRAMTEGLHQESVLCEANTRTLKGDPKRCKGDGDCQANSDLGCTGGL